MTFRQTRRSFLKTLIAVGVGATLDPERLLWTPGARTYFDLYQPDAGTTIVIDNATGLAMLQNQIIRLEHEAMRISGVQDGVLLIDRGVRWEWRPPDVASDGPSMT